MDFGSNGRGSRVFSGVGAERDGSEVDCVLANGRHDEGKRILIG